MVMPQIPVRGGFKEAWHPASWGHTSWLGSWGVSAGDSAGSAAAGATAVGVLSAAGIAMNSFA
jgi:hypothetical protein